ncbi:hypothetical protein GUJ93_ZPchr0010g7905 [Zizania palustris]|uniref:Uncharacterized protein n=1 Tax=Zizania palustris TaxID=103762 RepID=A0A8J5W7Z1_ZIZPA|nr:hypothetical protein GUJ93_ZPchr0010g7905 [Zizania palustris]
MDAAKKSRNPYKAPAGYRGDRKSASGMSGEPKKGGRGGKFTWEGGDGYYADEDLDLISPRSSNRKAATAATSSSSSSSSINKKAAGGGDE